LEPETATNVFTLNEHMTDMKSGQIRTHERQYYIKELGEIVNDAIYCGFIIQGKAFFKSSIPLTNREYLYFFQK
jgi:hypothetical protein